jgi:DNA processing protein
VIREPLRNAASTTKVPTLSPLMIRLRLGKFSAFGGVANGNSETIARGCHALIREGAKLVETARDIIEELGALVSLTEQEVSADEHPSVPTADPQLLTLLEHIGHDPVSVDTLVERSGLTPHTISSMLVEMELLGVVAACAGGRFMRV